MRMTTFIATAQDLVADEHVNMLSLLTRELKKMVERTHWKYPIEQRLMMLKQLSIHT